MDGTNVNEIRLNPDSYSPTGVSLYPYFSHYFSHSHCSAILSQYRKSKQVKGHFPCKSSAFIPGHEFAGIVEEIGTNVTHVNVGDRVAVNPNCPCDVCKSCCSGRYNICRISGIFASLGIFKDGGWAEYCVVPARQVFRIPDEISLAQAVLTEPISCVVHGFNRLGPIRVGERILIQGAGIIGNLWAAMLHHRGHRKVTVSEPSEIRREIFRNLGTSYDAVHPRELKDFQVDVIIECSGAGDATERALSLLSPGGRLCIFGVSSPDTRVSLSPYEVYEKEITIIGVIINKFTIPEALDLIAAIGSKFINFDKLGIREYRLNDYKEAFNDLKSGKISKAVFQIFQEH